MNPDYRRYLDIFYGALTVQRSKHAGQRQPLSEQGFARAQRVRKNRRRAAKAAQRRNRGRR